MPVSPGTLACPACVVDIIRALQVLALLMVTKLRGDLYGSATAVESIKKIVRS